MNTALALGITGEQHLHLSPHGYLADYFDECAAADARLCARAVERGDFESAARWANDFHRDEWRSRAVRVKTAAVEIVEADAFDVISTLAHENEPGRNAPEESAAE